MSASSPASTIVAGEGPPSRTARIATSEADRCPHEAGHGPCVNHFAGWYQFVGPKCETAGVNQGHLPDQVTICRTAHAAAARRIIFDKGRWTQPLPGSSLNYRFKILQVPFPAGLNSFGPRFQGSPYDLSEIVW
jgi:hypothetical protein